VIWHPLTIAVPIPVKIVPPQQNRYSPVAELNSSTVAGLVSSCRQTSNTLIVKLHVAVFIDASVAVQVTVVVPTGMHEPDGGVQATVTPGQLSLAVVVKFTTWHAWPAGTQTALFVTAVMFAGQVIWGGCVSLTVTLNEQLAPDSLVQLTGVVPTWKKVFDAGVHVIVPQSPVDVGAGYVTTAPH